MHRLEIINNWLVNKILGFLQGLLTIETIPATRILIGDCVEGAIQKY